jgi:hypothetical protein
LPLASSSLLERELWTRAVFWIHLVWIRPIELGAARHSSVGPVIELSSF